MGTRGGWRREGVSEPAWGVTVVFVLIVVFFPWEESKETAKRYACLSNVKRRALSLTMYAEDADGCFPARVRWMDATAVYLTPKALLYEGEDPHPDRSMRCPAVFKVGFGYAFNKALSGSKSPPRPESMPMVYDSTRLARNASDLVTSLPLPGRHGGKDNVAYADGHAKARVP